MPKRKTWTPTHFSSNFVTLWRSPARNFAPSNGISSVANCSVPPPQRRRS